MTTKAPEREFDYTLKDFKFISQFVYERVGINLTEAKRDLVYSRLSRRLRKLGLKKFSQYCDLLNDPERSQEELSACINAITTNLTRFFREEHHFEQLREEVIPSLLQRKKEQRRLRIWSAGCSTGEEPYSIAITLKECIPALPEWDVRILATDLDTNVLSTAQEGIYPEASISEVPLGVKKRWFFKDSTQGQNKVLVHPELKEMITFNQLNLMEEWPMKGPFDIIFCRNVIIYFDADTKRTLLNRYSDYLSTEEGYLFLGHSETAYKVTDRLELIGHTVYRKIR